MAGHRVREHEVLVGLKARALEVQLELSREAVGHRHRPAAMGLRAVKRAARVALGDAHARRRPVDVGPAQADQLALAQAGHRGGQVQRPLDRAEVIVGDRAQQSVELLALQEADAAMGVARRARPVHERDRIGRRPAALDREREQTVQEVQLVADGLRGQTRPPLGAQELLDTRGVDPVQRSLAEERR